MQFDGAFALAESRPREESQTQIDGRGIESVDRLFQFEAQGIAGVKLSGLCDEDASEIGVDAPIAVLIGLGQGVASDVPSEACVIQLGLQGVQTDFDVAQADSVSQLCKGHAQKLIEAREPAGAIIASVFVDTTVELSLGQEGHELGEQETACVHCQVLSTVGRGKD
jgi:hypothetical protein